MASPIMANNFSSVDNLQLTDTLGVQLSGRTSDPADADLAAGRVYYNSSSSALKVYDGSTWTSLSGTGGGGTPSWETLYAADATFGLTSATWTITQSAAADLLTLTKSNVGAGAVLAINNSGTGNDVTGTSGLWSVSVAGLATFATNSVMGGILKVGSGSATGEVTSNGAYDLVLETNSGTNSSKITITDAANGAITAAMNGTGKFTISGTTEGNTGFQLTNGDAVVSDGSLTLTDDDNDAASVAITNNTATTTGAASSLGVVNIVSTSLTTGALLNLELTEGTLAGGWYLRCWDATGAGSVFSVGENGDVVIAGTADSDALAITAGDFTMSDGKVAITNADNEDTLKVTNDGLTSASALELVGSGAFTGNTTSSFIHVTPSGLTSGTVAYLVANALTTGKVIDVSATAQTDGILLNVLGGGATVTATGRVAKLAMGAATVGQALEISTTGAYTGAGVVTVTADSATTAGATVGQGIVAVTADAITTGTLLDVTSTSIVLTTGRLADFSHISGDITGTLDKTSDLVSVVSTRTVTTGTVSDNFDMASLIRTDVINGGGTFAATGSVLYVENAVTNSSGTVTDTVIGVEVVMDSLGTGDGVKVTHSAAAGKAVNVMSSGTTAAGVVLVTANSLTSGQVVKLASSATAITGAGRMLLVDHTGATSTSGIISEFASAAADGTTVLRVTASAALTGVALDITAAAATTGTALDIGDLDALTSGKGINLVSNSADTGAFILEQITNDNALATGAVLLGLQQDSTGNSLYINHDGATGKAIYIDSEGTTQTGGIIDISPAVLTTGTVIDVGDADALTTGKILNLVSNSSDATARTLVQLTNDHASATGVTLLNMKQDAPTSTNYSKIFSMTNSAGTTVTIFCGSGTTPNGNLTGSQGDLCLNGDGSGNLFRCSSGTTWVSTI